MITVYLINIFPVLETGIHDQKQIKEGSTDHHHRNGFALGEVRVGKHTVPVDGIREHEKAASEGCQMGGQALRLREVGQAPHLQRGRIK